MKSNKSTSLIGENTDQLVLSLHHASNNDGKNLYFYLDKASPAIIYDINAIKKSLGNDICNSLLFIHDFTGCDITFAVFGFGKNLALQKILKGDSILNSCGKLFSTPKKHR